MPGPSAVPIVLSEDERAELVRRAEGPGRWRADRARIILACAGGMSNAAAAQALGSRSSRCRRGGASSLTSGWPGWRTPRRSGGRKAELVLDEAERSTFKMKPGAASSRG